MKKIIISALFFFSMVVSYSQSLAGVWKGSFGYKNKPYYSLQVRFEFFLNEDSTYSVYSYFNERKFRGIDTTFVCAVLYKKISDDSISLEEMRIIKPEKIRRNCRKKMLLKLVKRKHRMELEGPWKTYDDECETGGRLYLYKKD